jgi:very-long-chain ceramide synthase
VLNYIDSAITPYYFVSFMLIWAYLRHYINLVILKSLLPPFETTLSIPYTNQTFHIRTGEFATVGNYTLDFSMQQYKCWISQLITFGLLAALQAVNMFWFFLICRILLRIALKGVQKDERSEDEEEEEEPVAVEGNGSAKPQIAVNGKPLGAAKGDVSYADTVKDEKKR